jgi:hypothetical protein
MFSLAGPPLTAPGRFGVEARFNEDRIKKNTPPDFAKRHGPIPLAVPQPSDRWPTGFVE